MTTRRWVNALISSASAALTGLLVVGCSDDNASHVRPLHEGKFVETAASSRSEMEHAEALAAYRSWWSDLAAVSAAPDPSSPRLNDHAMGGALELMQHGLETARKQKIVTKGTPHPDPRIDSASPGKVVIRDCVDGTDWLQYKQNGELKNDTPGSHFKVDASVRRVDGVWKVSDLYMHEAGSC